MNTVAPSFHKLCLENSIRKDSSNNSLVRVKNREWEFKSILLSEVLWKNMFRDKILNTIQSTGHIFLRTNTVWNKDNIDVFLLTCKKENNEAQPQFTGWSYRKPGIIASNSQAEKNAIERLKERTFIQTVKSLNTTPIFDWVLKPSKDKTSWDLISLMHFVVSEYTGVLDYNPENTEDIIGWEWYNIKNISTLPWIAPNVELVINEAVKIFTDNQ